jgi:hypothetical protein
VLEDETFHSNGPANGRNEKQKEELGTKEETNKKKKNHCKDRIQKSACPLISIFSIIVQETIQ